ncbi:MAG: flagellar motor protein MotA [Kiloniellales bacterium]|nr:flagellar motor protein MotA [Kiloniellales bacterium]
MAIFLLVVGAICAVLYPRLQEAFSANAVLNGVILGVLLFGIGYSLRQVIALNPEVNWLQRLIREKSGSLVMPGAASDERPPKLLGPMVTMMGERTGRIRLSALSMRSLLDGIQSRISESHDMSRYLIGLLIFLGLLGTFWGLLETVGAVGATISGLSGGTGDATAMFDQLKQGLETPLSGMGTAFSSSLFGLAGSLILGFLELQAAQAHNRFVNELEEWLSEVTRLTGGGPLADGDQPVPAFIQALLEQTADSLDSLQRTMAKSEESRLNMDHSLEVLAERLGTLTDQLRSEQSILTRLAESQAQLRPVLSQLAEVNGTRVGGLDDASRDHLRNLDHHMGRLVQEAASGRNKAVEEIRSEIRLLARTIAALAEDTEAR